MTFIDWTDSEGMFGLLIDFVADERAGCPEDSERQRFLSDLLAILETLPAGHAVEGLKEAYDSAGPEFEDDPAMVHLKHCIEELERAESGSQ